MIRIFLQVLLFLILISCNNDKFIISAPEFQPSAKPLQDIDVAIVLSGGGSRGAAHLGVLEVLEKNNIPVNLIVGSSSGAVIGAFYADNPNCKHIKEILLNINKNDLIENIAFSYYGIPILYSGPVEGNKFRKFVYQNMKSENFDELKIPLVVVTTDILKHEPYLIRSGPIIPAIHASSALPLVFQPVKLYGRTLSDGAVISPVPVKSARLFKPKIVIAVNISAMPENTNIQSNWDLFRRAFDISYYQLTLEESALADIVIAPDLRDIGMFDDQNNYKSFEQGVIAAQKALPQILALLGSKGIHLTDHKHS
jgi:NTE family protein